MEQVSLFHQLYTFIIRRYLRIGALIRANPEPNQFEGRHPVFASFKPYFGPKESGCTVDYIGAFFIKEGLQEYDLLTDDQTNYREKIQCAYPEPDEEIFEWIDILESVVESKDSFVFVELGAGYGRWSIRAFKAAQVFGIPVDKINLITVEAERRHSDWLQKNMQLNHIPETILNHVEGAVSNFTGYGEFYVKQPDFKQDLSKQAREWYGQSLAKGNWGATETVKVLRLKDILEQAHFDVIDLIDMDLQGEDPIVLEDSQELFPKIKKFHIGTDSQKDAQAIKRVFSKHPSFKLIRSYPVHKKVYTKYGWIKFTDGVQTWVNLDLK